jgi:Trypsin-like peptidase domain
MNIFRQAAIFIACFLTTTSSATAADEYRDWSNVIRGNKNATVLIRIEYNDNVSYGSGVLLSSDGYVLTARHLLPDATVLPSVMLTALIGWEQASIDFSNARLLKTVYVSRKLDLAVMKFDPPPLNATFVSMDSGGYTGMPLLVMAYPSGGSLQSTPGIISGQGPGGTLTTSAVVGKGDSGGPVFGPTGAMTGIFLEGTARDASGTVELGYLLGASTIEKDLNDNLPTVKLTLGPPPAVTLPPLPQVSLSYSLDDDKTDHPGLTPTSDARERVFYAVNGYRITSVAYQDNSRNHADYPQLVISSDGGSITAKYTITSGPLYDQWRGWIVGSIITQQVHR